MIAAPIIQHINLDEQGIARIAGTSLKVSDIAIDAETWGMTAREIQKNYPQLSVSQIYAALSYYYDHKAEMDALLDGEDEEYEIARSQETEPLTRSMLTERLQRKQADERAV